MATVTITRRELYDQVWSKPMMHLAKEYGLSDVGMAKLCRRLNIPRPPRGYWTKLEFGHRTRKMPLPNPNENSGITMSISNQLQDEADAVNAEVQKALDRERDADRRIVVAKTLRGCHELVAKTNPELQIADKNDRGLLIKPDNLPLDVFVSKPQLHRALLIMDAIIKALEQRGYAVTRGPHVDILGQSISFGIREHVDLVREQPDEHDLDGSYSFAYDRFHSKLVPSGRLILCIHDAERYWVRNCRATWRDAKKQKLEDCLNKFVSGLVKVADNVRQHAIEEERRAIAEAETERRRQEESRIRAEKRSLQKHERTKVRNLFRQARRWKQSQDVRAFIEARKRQHISDVGPIGPDDELAQWITWALEQADRLDPLRESPPSILDEEIPEEKSRWYV